MQALINIPDNCVAWAIKNGGLEETVNRLLAEAMDPAEVTEFDRNKVEHVEYTLGLAKVELATLSAEEWSVFHGVRGILQDWESRLEFNIKDLMERVGCSHLTAEQYVRTFHRLGLSLTGMLRDPALAYQNPGSTRLFRN